jgi:hypothetical protein
MEHLAQARNPGAWLRSGQPEVDVVEAKDAAVSHSFSAWRMLRGVLPPNLMAMRASMHSPALPHKQLLLFLYSLVEALKLMMNQSLTIKMRRLVLTLLYRIVVASTG